MAQTVDDAVVSYFTERGFERRQEHSPYTYDFFQSVSVKMPRQTRQVAPNNRGDWFAKVVNWTGPDWAVCNDLPDPITCFITAELMNWSNSDA